MLSFGKTAGRLTAMIMVFWFCAQPLRAQTQPIQYYYDDLGRLVTMVDQSGNVTNYSYDAVGNILAIGRSTVTLGSLAIFDFNPQSGPVGIPVTIRGQGFSATASSDIVKFSGTVASVTSASTTTLVATVPVGATTGPISVTVRGKTATSTTNFVVVAAVVPAITSTWPKSALFNVAIQSVQITGVNLLGAAFFVSPTGGPTVSNASVGPTGTTATLTFSSGSTAGTYALVAGNGYGNSGSVAIPANRITVVDPTSTADTDGDGFSDVVEASFGTDPLDPNSFPTGSTVPLIDEVDGVPFSVLDTSEGTQPIQYETDGVLFSVLDTSQGTQPVQDESDGILFSVQNNAESTKAARKSTPPALPVGGGDNKKASASSPQKGTAGTSRQPEAAVQQTQPENQR